jgi:DNA mismatch repair ATPase MutS
MELVFQEEDVSEFDEKSIVFLYTVSPGPCSKSHGFNAARLAGLPAPIIERALKVAEQFEHEQNNLLELAKIINAH